MTDLSREDRDEMIGYLRRCAGDGPFTGPGTESPTPRTLREWADKLEAEPRAQMIQSSAHGLRERVAGMLAENDKAGTGPLSRGEYLDDADALINLVRQAEPEPVSVEPVATLWRCPEHGVTGHGCTAEPGCDHVVTPVPVSPTADLEALQDRLDRATAALAAAVGEVRKLAPAERERDEARSALEAWTKTYTKTAVERDEAREALREIAELASHPNSDFRIRDIARAAVEGVERTHVLVPNKSLIALATCAYGATMAAISDGFCEPDRVWLHDTAVAADRAARGESVQWPETER
jgi:hypothetical protein